MIIYYLLFIVNIFIIVENSNGLVGLGGQGSYRGRQGKGSNSMRGGLKKNKKRCQ